MVGATMPGRVWNTRARPRRHAIPMQAFDNLLAKSESVVVAREDTKRSLPLSENAKQLIAHSRQTIRNILGDADHRLFVVVGPCSIHDIEAALEYTRRLKELADKLSDTFYLVMRVYFEKPRTTAGWKGLINDPDLDGSFRIEEGLMIARRLLITIAELGLPVATEALDPIAQQYLQDLISWTAIGARTTESQTHSELASGLSSPIGFKNGTDGDLTVAANAMKSAAQPHSFLGINGKGRVSIIQTKGCTDTHIVLRVGGGKPNYDSVNVKLCERLLIEHGLTPRIMIDCSHANLQNKYELQPPVMHDVINQILEGNRSIKALMIEGNLCARSQPLVGNIAELRHGASITGQCIDWEATEGGLSGMREKLRYVLPGRKYAGERLLIEDVAFPLSRASRSLTIGGPVNVCLSTLPAFALDDCLTLAAAAGYQGVEVRVHDNYHISLPQLYYQCGQLKRSIEANKLDLSVYTTYYGVNDSCAVDTLIRICQRTGVRYFRVTLPVAGKAQVRTQAFEEAVVPSYEHRAMPTEILRSVKASLQSLARRAKAAGVCALVEIHWGTVMSSFTSAHYLVDDLDPDAVAITLDPANMVIEGKEDWEYGVHLLREHVANVHIKNVSWLREGEGWKWRWDGLQQGMVDWPQLFRLLADVGYRGMFAMEDFRVPRHFDEALAHLRELREETRFLLRQSESRQAARLPLR